MAVVDQDRSPYSQRLVEEVTSSPYFKLSGTFSTYEEALQSVENDRSDLILEIPPHFERDRGAQLYTVQHFNPTLQYIYFMIPALMVMIMAMISGFLPALNIVEEKENGTIKQINVTPVKKRTFILSKLIPYWIIGFVVINICIRVSWLFYGFLPKGSIFTLYIVFIFTFCGLGLVVSNYAATIQQAMFMLIHTCLNPSYSFRHGYMCLSYSHFGNFILPLPLKNKGYNANMKNTHPDRCPFPISFNTLIPQSHDLLLFRNRKFPLRGTNDRPATKRHDSLHCRVYPTKPVHFSVAERRADRLLFPNLFLGNADYRDGICGQTVIREL